MAIINDIEEVITSERDDGIIPYLPLASYGSYGISKYNKRDFTVVDGVVTLKHSEHILPLRSGDFDYSFYQTSEDVDVNRVYGRGCISFGGSCTSGCKGYYITELHYIDDNTAELKLANSRSSKGIKISDNTLTREAVSAIGYEIGKSFSIVLAKHYVNIGTIVSIERNVVTVSGDINKLKSGIQESIDSGNIISALGYIYVWSALVSIDDYGFYVAEQPDVGKVELNMMSYAEGYGNYASGNIAHAEGRRTIVAGAYGHSEGRETLAGYCDHAEGYKTIAIGGYSHSEGDSTIAKGFRSHSEGYKCEALANSCHAEGFDTAAIGLYTHSSGYKTVAFGKGSYSEGYSSINAYKDVTDFIKYASMIDVSDTSTSTGIDAIYNKWSASKFAAAIGNYSHIEGEDCVVLGDGCHGEGYRSFINGIYSHAEGYNNKIFQRARGAHVEGGENQAKGNWTHAEGYHNISWGRASHVEGEESNSGQNAIAAHVEGGYNTASHQYSHVGGYYNSSSADYQTTIGCYGKSNQYALLIVGGGTSSKRANIFEAILKSGVKSIKVGDTEITESNFITILQRIQSYGSTSMKLGNTELTEETLVKLLQMLEAYNIAQATNETEGV